MARLNIFQRFVHWVAHKTGSNEGHVVTYEENGRIYVAFQCAGCGQIDPSTVDSIDMKELNHE